MNRAELVNKISEKLDISKKEATDVISIMMDTVIEGAIDDGECVLPGIGKIVKVPTAPRKGVTNGVEWSKDASETLRLRLSKAGKELFN